MPKLLLVLLILLPLTAHPQTTFDLPDGSRFQAYLAVPDNDAAPARLAIVMGGGAGDNRIASGTFNSLGKEFLEHGWAVATPVSPNGQSFWGANAAKVRQLITLLQARDDIAGGKVLLAGISNGGISSLEIASLHPEEYLGVVAVPALANDDSVRNLAGFPIFLRIGSEDQLGWASRYDATVRAMNKAGAVVDAKLVDGAPHRVPVDWAELAPWLDALAD